MSNPKPSLRLEDTAEVQKVFNRFDTNGDGMISVDELGGVLRALGSATSDEEIVQMMNEIDTDKDGQINVDEFAAFYNGSGEKELREAFEMYDQDGDGKISAGELHQVLTRLGEHCSMEDCVGMIRSFDSDRDGYVGFDEFRNMMMTNNKT